MKKAIVTAVEKCVTRVLTKKNPHIAMGKLNRQLVGQRVINQAAEQFCRKLHLKPGQRQHKKH